MDDNEDFSAVDFNEAGACAEPWRAVTRTRAATGKRPDFLLYAKHGGAYVKVGAAWRIEANAKGKGGFSMRIDDRTPCPIRGEVVYMWPNEPPAVDEVTPTAKEAPADAANPSKEKLS